MTPTDAEIDERNEVRDRRVLEAARSLIRREGLKALTRDAIADEARLAAASVSNFGRTRISNGTHDTLGYRERIMSALMLEAQETRDVAMLRVGLVDGCIQASDLSDEMRGLV